MISMVKIVQCGEHCSMSILKKELFVVVIKGQLVHFGLYLIVDKRAKLLLSHEHLFPDDTLINGYIFNVPLFVDSIRHFLTQRTDNIATMICFDDGIVHKIFGQSIPEQLSEDIPQRYQSIQFFSCCDSLQRRYSWNYPYYIILQYTMIFTLHKCHIITIIPSLYSLFYLNHYHGQKQHQLLFEHGNFQQEKMVQLYFKRIPHIKTVLELYSLASAHVGIDML